jgi:hypothetical protein
VGFFPKISDGQALVSHATKESWPAVDASYSTRVAQRRPVNQTEADMGRAESARRKRALSLPGWVNLTSLGIVIVDDHPSKGRNGPMSSTVWAVPATRVRETYILRFLKDARCSVRVVVLGLVDPSPLEPDTQQKGEALGSTKRWTGPDGTRHCYRRSV